MMEIETKPVYDVVVQFGHNAKREVKRYTDPETAAAAVRNAVAVLSVDPADFDGQVSWSTEQVPATPFDELVEQYQYELHGALPGDPGDGLAGVDRESPFLMVEENAHGGYWLSSGVTAEHLARGHLNQEYAEDWEIVGIFDARTGEQVHVTVEVDL